MITGIVLVYGWRLVDTPWVNLVPVISYIVLGNAIALVYFIQGPATRLNYLGLLGGVLQLYNQGRPLFQWVSQVSQLCRQSTQSQHRLLLACLRTHNAHRSLSVQLWCTLHTWQPARH
jgi:hypothetical protein